MQSQKKQTNAVTYSTILHRGAERIAIYCNYSATANSKIRKVPGAKWSRTLGCWHIPDTAENRATCKIAETKKETDPIAKNKPVSNTTGKAGVPAAVKASQNAVTFSEANAVAMAKYVQRLQPKAYSTSTIKTYRNEFGNFLQTLGNVSAESITTDRLKDYLQYCYASLKLSENTIHSRINALKFYYEQVLNREKFFWDIPRPKKPFLLPKLLNEDELRRLFAALPNKKHKAMLFTAYSAGLRVSEIAKLKIADIDSTRMQIFIERAKGKKDRYVNLSPVLLDILRKYIKEYKPSPKVYLFESEQTLMAYPTRTIQMIFSTAKQKAGIKKDVGIHSLRHSFATHLLDKGTETLSDGTPVAKITLATTEAYKLKNGETQSRTDWHNVIIWRGLAELAKNFVHKGSLLYIEGKLRNRQYEGKDGEKKYVTEVVADQMDLLDKKTKVDSEESYDRDVPF